VQRNVAAHVIGAPYAVICVATTRHFGYPGRSDQRSETILGIDNMNQDITARAMPERMANELCRPWGFQVV
jgi:hypothetical protein